MKIIENQTETINAMLRFCDKLDQQRNTAELCGFDSWAMLEFRQSYDNYAIMTKEYADCAAMRLRGCSYAKTCFAALDLIYFGINN